VDPQAAIADRREQLAGMLAEKAAALACDLQAQALVAEDVDQKVRLSHSFVRVARFAGQVMALQEKFERGRAEAQAQAAAKPQPPAPPEPPKPADPRAAAVDRRKAVVIRAVQRCVWRDYDDDDPTDEATADSLMCDLAERLDELAADEAFLTADLDALIEAFCTELGLEPPARPVRATLTPPTSPIAAATGGVVCQHLTPGDRT
jgi:hypothetical protein